MAVDQESRLDLPPFDKAAVDGYAVSGSDAEETYHMAGVVTAGYPGRSTLTPGTTFKVMTGAPVPTGTTRVVKVEQAEERGGVVRFETLRGGNNVCRRAEDVAVGQTVLKAGRRLGPLEIANLIGCGVTDVEVFHRPRLAVISTGDEVVDAVADLRPGRILNTNGPLLGGLARNWGLSIAFERTVVDDQVKLKSALHQALSEADVVVVSGGVSAGDFDFVPKVVTDSGLLIHFSRVAVKPGMPALFATGADGIVFGLPGNPVAAYLMFHLLVLRAAARLCGATSEPRRVDIALSHEIARASTARTEYLPCRITSEGLAETIRYHGSGHLAALMQADGFLVIPEGVEALAAGAKVRMAMFG